MIAAGDPRQRLGVRANLGSLERQGRRPAGQLDRCQPTGAGYRLQTVEIGRDLGSRVADNDMVHGHDLYKGVRGTGRLGGGQRQSLRS